MESMKSIDIKMALVVVLYFDSFHLFGIVPYEYEISFSSSAFVECYSIYSWISLSYFFSTLCLCFCNCICPIYRNTIILEICQTAYSPYVQCTSFDFKKTNHFKLNIMKNSNKMSKSKNIFIGNKFFWSNLSQYVWFYSEIKNWT